MHIVLLVLKIIGAILGGLLGLLLLLVLLVVFVPVRYQIHLVVKENVNVDSSVWWLLHAVHVSIRYHENGMQYCMRIFGFPIRQNKEENGKKTKRRPEKTGKERKRHRNKGKKQVKQVDTAKTKEITAKQKRDKAILEEKKETVQDITKPEETTKKQKKKVTLEQKSQRMNPEKRTEKDEPGKEKGFHPFKRIRNLLQKIKDIIANIPRLWNKIKEKASKLNQKKKRFLAILREEGTRNSLRKIKGRIFEVFRYIGPRKLKGYVRFGTGDPCNTGQILGIVSILRAYFNTKVKIYPVFEEKVIEADLTARGRLRVIRFLRIGSVLYFDKEIKKFIADVKQIKEELNG